MSLGGTRTTCWPAPSRSRSSRRDRCRQSSTAQRRSAPNRAAQTSKSRWSVVVVLTVRSPSLRPCSSTTTTVWVCLCASIPRITMVWSPLTSGEWGPDRSVGMPQLGRRHAPIKPRRSVRVGVAGRTTGTGHAGTEHWSEPATPSSLPSTKPDIEAEHWHRIRHSNLIERTVGETRRRTKVIGRLPARPPACHWSGPSWTTPAAASAGSP